MPPMMLLRITQRPIVETEFRHPASGGRRPWLPPVPLRREAGVDALADGGLGDLCPGVPTVCGRTHRAGTGVQYQSEGEYPRDDGAVCAHPQPDLCVRGVDERGNPCLRSSPVVAV